MLVAYLASTMIPGYVEALSLSSCRTGVLANLPTLLGHSLVLGSGGHLLMSCLSIIFSALLCEPELGTRRVLTLWAGASFLGAISYLLVSHDCSRFVGPAAFVWGFAGAAMAVAILRWHQTSWYEKAYVAVVLLSSVTLLQLPLAVTALQLTGLLLGFAVAYYRHQNLSEIASNVAGTKA